MTFKKNPTPSECSARPTLPGLPGGRSWAATVEEMAREVIATIQCALGMTLAPAQPEEHLRYRPSRRNRGRARPMRRNMRHVSRRTNLKHRRARKAA